MVKYQPEKTRCFNTATTQKGVAKYEVYHSTNQLQLKDRTMPVEIIALGPLQINTPNKGKRQENIYKKEKGPLI